MKFTTTIKEMEVRNVTVYGGGDESYWTVSGLNIEWAIEYEIRKYGVKSTTVSVLKWAIDLMDIDNDDKEISLEGFTMESEQPTDYETIYIEEIEIDLKDKTVNIKFA